MNYKRYDCTITNVKQMLDEYGVAVIPNVLTQQECEQSINEIWNDLSELTKNMDCPLKKNDTSTWKTLHELYPLHSMLIQYFGIGHAQSVWNVRQNKKIGKIFGKIHDCNKNELLTSFDGISLHLPPEVTKRGWYKNNNWLHTDQSHLKDDYCIQGMITLYDVNEHDASLMVLEKSHKYHSDFFLDFDKKIKSDWYKLTENEFHYFLDKGCMPWCVMATKGSLILWNSKTIHQGIEA